ncbi:MAG: hypothetical protein ACK401_04550 [Archaeoglobaceae archaeon]
MQLKGLKEYIILKGEEICEGRKACDCIVYSSIDDKLIVAVVELKSKDVHASEIREKLENCLNETSRILEECCHHAKAEFHLLVLHKGMSRPEYNMITSKEIEFKGEEHPILLEKCGSSFSEI